MGWGINSMFQANVTLVANAFIDEYLALANGDYVKVYLFLLFSYFFFILPFYVVVSLLFVLTTSYSYLYIAF